MLQRKIFAIQLSQNPNPADNCAEQQYPVVGGPLKIEKQIAKIFDTRMECCYECVKRMW